MTIKRKNDMNHQWEVDERFGYATSYRCKICSCSKMVSWMPGWPPSSEYYKNNEKSDMEPQCKSIRQAGVMLIIRDGMILGISRRHNKEIFGLPGGKLDPETDETPMDTAIRETAEETTVIVKSCVRVYQRVELGDGPNKEDFYSTCYYATGWDGEPKNSEEGVVKWLTPKEVCSTKAAFGDYNTKTLEIFKQMFPNVSLVGE
jgi:ADP-ribose pyrophosphatase YjhB (NUDIX family)